MVKWLSKYEQGGMVLKQKTKDNYGKKENANAGYSTAGPGWVGEGTTNRGFNYNGAWGGTMQNGGFLQPTSYKLPPAANEGAMSTEKATSIGGGPGEPAYLIPTFKYGKPLKDPEAEYRKTGEHLGGPFKTYQEAEKFGEMRHKYVEQGRNIPSPLKWWGEMQDGGTMPTDKKSQKFYGMLKDYYTAPDRTEKEKAQYAAFNKLNEEYGYAPVGVKNRTIMGNRSMINPFSGRLNVVAGADPEVGEIKSTPQKLMDQYLEEYSHYQQYNENPEESKIKKTGKFLGHMAKDFGQMIKNTKGLNFKKGYDQNYLTPGTTEYEAHRVIQPRLKKELETKVEQEMQDRMAMGGSIPGAVGFTYARVAGSAPANGKYTKKTKASAENGKEMRYWQEGLDFKPKTISKNGGWLDGYNDPIKDDMGQWTHPGEVTEINSNEITMKGVPYNVIGISDKGDVKDMKPGKDYKFKGSKVTEYPKGGWLNKYK